ncbi:hypothetical protein LSCM4_06075 [Leishmania orientalis]|uniref:Uncharacterized protein n=1 Tax=Leishmania orientalis TaxID=2249476 RepID=A0A836GWA5_9TRYP|nr:hypothetical protein LSCM4_06075 [Leishmania orientalis]
MKTLMVFRLESRTRSRRVDSRCSCTTRTLKWCTAMHRFSSLSAPRSRTGRATLATLSARLSPSALPNRQERCTRHLQHLRWFGASTLLVLWLARPPSVCASCGSSASRSPSLHPTGDSRRSRPLRRWCLLLLPMESLCHPFTASRELWSGLA